jgi:hypothetical protein
VASGREIARLEGHKKRVNSIAFSPDGARLASDDSLGTVGLWDVASGREIARLEGRVAAGLSVAFSVDGARLASGSRDGTVRLWDVASGREIARLEAHNEVRSVAFSPDGARLASSGEDTTVRLWDVASGREIARLAGDSWVWSVAFSPDGARLASGSLLGTLRVWDVASEREIARLEGHKDAVYSVAFSPDGARLASGGEDSTVRLWDLASGREIARLEGHKGAVNSVAFSPDGARLASGGSDGTVRLWDVVSGREIARLEGHKDEVASVAFSRDGTRLASGGEDGVIRQWEVPSGKLLWISVPGSRGAWLACLVAEQRCWRTDDGTLLVRSNDAGFLTAVPPLGGAAPPTLSAAVAAKTRIEERHLVELPVTIRNTGAAAAYWVRITSPVRVVPGDQPRLVAGPSLVIQRLDPGRSARVTVPVAAQLPHDNPVEAGLTLPLVLEAMGREPTPLPAVEVDLPAPAPRLERATLIKSPSGAASISAELSNTGSADFRTLPDVKAEPLDGAGKSLGDASASLPPGSALPADPQTKRPLSIALAATVDPSALKRLKVVVSDTQNPLHQWVLEVPVTSLRTAHWLFAAAALAAVTVLLGIAFQLVYRNPLTVQLSKEPSALLNLDPERLARARSLLRLTRRLPDILDHVKSNLPWLNAAIAFTRGDALARAEVLAQRLETTLVEPPAIATDAILAIGLRPPPRFLLAVDELVLLLPDAATPAEDVFATWRRANLGSRPIGVIAAAAAQRRQLARLAERSSDNLVVLSGAEITRLLISPAPVETLARAVANGVDLSRISPYQINSAIMRERVFFGRHEQLRHILERDLGNYILLGARQLGKSSLLREIERRLQRRGEVAVDYESVSDKPIASVLARLAGVTKEASPSEIAASLRASAAPRPHLILLDECDRFVAEDAARKPPFPVMEAMRRLSADGNCHFILAGFWQLYAIVHLTYHAPLRNFGETLTLGGLEPEAAHALLCEPMAVLGVSWRDQADIERIADETGRRPNLLQIVGNELLKELGPRRVIESEDVDRVLRSRPIADSLAGWITLTDDAYGRCLDQIVVWAMLERDSFTLSELTRQLAELSGRIAVPVAALQSSLQRLDLAFIIGEEAGVYRWRVPLFRTRRRLEASEEQLREQLARLATLLVPATY